MPEWFIACAGLLMVGSSALYFLKPLEGFYAVMLCMGGAFATAGSFPKPHERPGGMLFSGLTVFAAFWVKRTSLTLPVIGISIVTFAAGVAGRMYVMDHPEKVGLGFLAKLGSKKKKELEKKASGSESKTEGKKTAGEKMPQKTQEASKSGSRKRAESPGLRSTPVSE